MLTSAEVAARYRLADQRTARRIMREAGAVMVAGRLLVDPAHLAAWERRQAEPIPGDAVSAPVAFGGVKPRGWWRETDSASADHGRA